MEKPAEQPKEQQAPPILKEPIIKLENNGQILVVRFVVSSPVKPTAMWTVGGIPVKSAGRYYLMVQPNKAVKEEYFVTLECKSVSLGYSYFA